MQHYQKDIEHYLIRTNLSCKETRNLFWPSEQIADFPLGHGYRGTWDQAPSLSREDENLEPSIS